MQALRSKRKSNRVLHACDFPRLTHVTCVCSGWLIALFASLVIGQSDVLWFCYSQLKTSLIRQGDLETNLFQISLGTKPSHTAGQTCQTEGTGAEPVKPTDIALACKPVILGGEGGDSLLPGY